MIDRLRSEADERQVIARLTEAGRAMQARCDCLGETLIAAAGMPVERLRRLADEIRQLRDTLAGEDAAA